ncbi:hypothetical protein ABPG74_006320 [Tetrahymena malaccensis]
MANTQTERMAFTYSFIRFQLTAIFQIDTTVNCFFVRGIRVVVSLVLAEGKCMDLNAQTYNQIRLPYIRIKNEEQFGGILSLSPKTQIMLLQREISEFQQEILFSQENFISLENKNPIETYKWNSV